jgi:ribosomal protein L33
MIHPSSFCTSWLTTACISSSYTSSKNKVYKPQQINLVRRQTK